MSNTRKSVFVSVVSLVLCLSMLLGTTFAWFTDQVVSSDNIIQSGKLDVDLHWTEDLGGTWHETANVDDDPIFNYDNWEPGFTQVRYLKVINAGNLAFQFALRISPNGEVGKLAEVMDVYIVKNPTENIDARTDIANMLPVGTLAELIADPTDMHSVLLPEGISEPGFYTGEMVLGVVIKMHESAGNEYQDSSVGDSFNVEIHATQYTYEEDAFGNDYDTEAKLPDFSFSGNISDGGSANITVSGGQVAEDVTVSGASVSAQVPAGVKVNDGADKLSLSVQEMDATESNVQLKDGEAMKSVNVHMDGVATDNTVPMLVTMPQAAAKGLNKGNLQLYHVENGTTVAMTQVDTLAQLTAHNQFYYDPATGDVTLSLATFSEIALVADTTGAWEGAYDYTWYNVDNTDLKIANADQLAAFGRIVGGMDGHARDDFSTKTVTLLSDINLNDAEKANTSKIFHPIGYYYTDDNNADGTTGDYYCSLKSFKGTFDGAGHTVSSFYQNTWEIKGDYDGNYYDSGMGLFGYVHGGTVKNLTVDNFSSDGEFTPTGCIAAYACGARFENIAITNCNPRVYNTGNGGIIGIAGNTSAGHEDHHLELTNITVDNSNKISALWGSWDVACGGLIGMYRSALSDGAHVSTVNFTNCHVSAQIDVNNDVCANYQYYAYRYAGMIIGSVRDNVTGADGRVYPNMTGITADGCTVHFGDWNDYYYCELVANTLASYTHDHQFSRLTQVASVDVTNKTVTDLKGNTTAIPTSGRQNYVVVTGDHATENAKCYHFVDGKVHNHSDYNGDGTDDYETVNGQSVLVENNQHIYLEFNQLFTGYSWGVNSIGVNEYHGFEVLDITLGDQEESVEKFLAVTEEVEISDGDMITVGQLFTANPTHADKIDPANIQVFVSPVGADSTVTATYTPNAEDWTKSTLTFAGVGNAEVIISDYRFCKEAKKSVQINTQDKFIAKFDNDQEKEGVQTAFTYRVGNDNAVKLQYFFAAAEHAVINSAKVEITVENVSGTASGEFTPNTSDWKNATIQFSGLGVVNVTISGDNATAVTLPLEVVEAVNATGASSATANNVVLLQDAGFSTLTVSGGYTLYGNGFTLTCGSDSAVLDMGYAFVTLSSGILDNVQIVCPNFDNAALYKSNLTGGVTDSAGKTRYYNAMSAVMASGNSQILNSRISGARAAVNVSGGNLVIDNSRIELGAVANILVGSANSLTLRDVTLVQKPAVSTRDSSKTLMGFSVLYMCDSEGNATPTTLEGRLIQHAWADENDAQYVPEAGKTIVTTVLKETEYLHDIDGDGTKESLNLGFAYMPEDASKSVSEPNNITDNRTDKATVPYDYKDVKIQIAIVSTTVYVYSYKNTNETAADIKNESVYESNKYGDIITVAYSDTADGLESTKSFGTSGWIYELNVDLDKLSGYALDFSKLTMTVNGVVVSDFQVNGSAKPTTPVAVVAGGTEYVLTTTIDGKTCKATYKVTGTETSKESPSLVGTPSYGAGFGVANKYGGDWSAAAPVLDGITVRYWSVADSEYKEFPLSGITFASGGKQNGTNNYWEYTHANNDFTLKVTNTAVMHSNSGSYGMPVAGKDGKLYFTISKTGGFVSTGTTSRSIAISYEFTDNNGGDVLKFSHTWNIAYNKDDQYNYNSFTSDGTLTKLESGSSGGGGSCVTPDTLITLADGRQVRVDSLTGDEELLVWNLQTGSFDSAPILFIDTDPASEYEIVHLYFSDGTDVKVIYEHGFWDYDLNKYVYLDRNADKYIGHTFAKQNGDKLEKVQLTDVVLETEITTAWSPVTAEHLCYFVNGMLSMPGGVGGLFNIFEVNPDTMAYNSLAMLLDIHKYGLFTYEELAQLAPGLSREMFEAAGGAFLKVSIGKGNLTEEELLYMINRYSKFF